MLRHYILNDDHEPVAAELMEWARWFETATRTVAHDELDDGTRVSTVFLGLDYGFGEGPPVLWETMIFGGEHDDDQWRYTSRESALEGHASALKLARDD